jgi:hypothetical protein
LPYIVGSRIEAYCANCKGDQVHIVIEMAGVRIRAVKCEKCQIEGDFKTPREKARAAIMQYAAKKRRSSPPPKPRGRARKSNSPKAVFERLIEGLDLETATPYDIKAQLREGELVEHPNFGIGVVTALIDLHKAKIFFQKGERVMVCNRQ